MLAAGPVMPSLHPVSFLSVFFFFFLQSLSYLLMKLQVNTEKLLQRRERDQIWDCHGRLHILEVTLGLSDS